MASKRLTIRLKSHLSELGRLRQSVIEFGHRHRVSSDALFHVILSLEEVLTNIISYGYDDNQEHEILIRVSLVQNDLTVKVEDDGRAFNPLEVAEPNLSQPLEERQVGGLGIHFVRKFMNEARYARRRGKNLLVLKKNLALMEP